MRHCGNVKRIKGGGAFRNMRVFTVSSIPVLDQVMISRVKSVS